MLVGKIVRLKDCAILLMELKLFEILVQPENIVSSVGSIALYIISSFVLFFVLVPFNRL